MKIRDASQSNAGGELVNHSSVRPPTPNVNPALGESNEPEHSPAALLKVQGPVVFNPNPAPTLREGVTVHAGTSRIRATGDAVSNPNFSIKNAPAIKAAPAKAEVPIPVAKAQPPSSTPQGQRPATYSPENFRASVTTRD